MEKSENFSLIYSIGVPRKVLMKGGRMILEMFCLILKDNFRKKTTVCSEGRMTKTQRELFSYAVNNLKKALIRVR